MRCSCRWMFNSKCQHLQVSLSHLNGKLIWRRCVLVPSRRPDATCNRERFNCINAFSFQLVDVFFHSHNQLGSLTWFTLSRNQIWSNFSFTKFQVRRQSEAATQVNKSIILYYFPVFVDSWGEAKKIWWQTKNKTKTIFFPADWPLVLAIFCLAQPVENNNGPPVFLM